MSSASSLKLGLLLFVWRLKSSDVDFLLEQFEPETTPTPPLNVRRDVRKWCWYGRFQLQRDASRQTDADESWSWCAPLGFSVCLNSLCWALCHRVQFKPRSLEFLLLESIYNLIAFLRLCSYCSLNASQSVQMERQVSCYTPVQGKIKKPHHSVTVLSFCVGGLSMNLPISCCMKK